MSKFWHLVKFNIIFNRVTIVFLSFLSIFIVGICTYFYEVEKELGEALMQYSFYIMFMIFTGKMNSKNSMMFDVKHMLALPLTKKETIILKSFADSIQMLPVAAVFLYGVSLAFPKYHVFMAAIIIYLVLTLGNIIAFNKRIDFSRMQHSKASFKNSFLFLHKYLEMFIQIIITVMAIGLVIAVFEKNIFMQEYGFLILISTGLFLAASNTLKMLKDETRSYFILKRDAFRIGWKVIVVVLPLLFFHKAYKTGDLIKGLGSSSNKDALTNKLIEKVKYIKNVGDKKVLLTIINNDEKGFDEYLAGKNEIPWNSEVMGSYPPHLAAGNGGVDIINKIIDIRPDAVNMPGKFKKKTPIYAAIRKCKLDVMELLLNRGANINHQDIDGNTPIHFAAQRKCYGGVLLLQEKGAKTHLKNMKGKYVVDYIPKSSGLRYFINNNKPEAKTPRSLASEKITTSSKKSEKEPQPLK